MNTGKNGIDHNRQVEGFQEIRGGLGIELYFSSGRRGCGLKVQAQIVQVERRLCA